MTAESLHGLVTSTRRSVTPTSLMNRAVNSVLLPLLLLLITTLTAACGGDDENMNPLAPSPSTQTALTGTAPSASEYQTGAGGASLVDGLGGMRASTSNAACLPNAGIVARAESNRKANDRPPGYGRSWKQLLVFLGDDWPGHDPVTLAEMDARVGRWGGWKPFRDEVKRLLDCGWTPPTTIDAQQEPQTPMPQQSTPPPLPTATPSTLTITEGTSGTVTFTITPDSGNCRMRGVMEIGLPTPDSYPDGLTLTGTAGSYRAAGQSGWNDPNCDHLVNGSRTYTLAYSSTSNGVPGETYADSGIQYWNVPNGSSTPDRSAKLINISYVDDGLRTATMEDVGFESDSVTIEEGKRALVRFVGGPSSGLHPVKFQYRTCSYKPGSTCVLSGPKMNWEGTGVEEWGVSGLKDCAGGGSCIYPNEHIGGWLSDGSFTASFYHTDDNSVGKNKRWEVCVVGSTHSTPCTEVITEEDDLLQVSLRPGGRSSGDYSHADLRIYRDFHGSFNVELVATGVARINGVTSNGSNRGTVAAGSTSHTTRYGSGQESARDAVRRIALSCNGNGPGWLEASHDADPTQGTTDREQVCR